MQEMTPGTALAVKGDSTKPDDDGDEDNLPQLTAWFEDAEEATEDARKTSERDRDYFDGKQFTAAELKILRDRGQPDIVINRIQPKVTFLLGWEASNRTDPRAFPRTPMDEDASEAATDALRYVHDASDLQQHFSGCWEHMLVEGYGGLELTIEANQDGQPEIVPVMWPWDRLFYDPHSRRHDFSDARYVGGVLWMDHEEVTERWPEAADAIGTMVNEQSFSRTYDDRPNKWVSRGSVGSGRKRVRIVQMYHREDGVWRHCTFTKGAKLEAMDVPFIDQKGLSWCPLLLQSAYVDRQNNRYGLVRSMIGVQDEINKRRAKALHRLTMRQFQFERGAVDDVDAMKAELAKPDGAIETNPGFAFAPLDKTAELRGELELLQEAKNEIELLGPNAAMLGKDSKAPSGRAILANQQSGQTEISFLLDRHRHLKKRTYQRIWDLIRQYKNAEWWVRVTDDEKNVKFVGLNRPVTVKEELAKRMEGQGMPPEEIQAAMAQLQGDPRLEQVVRTENNTTEMNMDITIEEVPDSANVQMEQFEQLTRLAPAVVFPPEIYIEASSLRNKKRLLEIMKSGEQQDPVAAEAAKIQLEQTIKKTEAEIDKLRADALKARVDADVADAQLGMITDPRIVQAGGNAAPALQSAPAQQAGVMSVPAAEGMPGESAMPPPGF